jgi:hypothetical protein
MSMRCRRVRTAGLIITRLRSAWRVPNADRARLLSQASSHLRCSRKRDVHSVSFPGCNAYITVVKKNQQEALLTRAAAIAGANSPHATTLRRTTMTTFKTLIAAALLSMTAVTSASAQLPGWAVTNPDSFQAQYPNRDVLNGGALTPAGRMGLELAGGAAPVFGARNAYAATNRETASSCARIYHSYDAASGTFLGYDGRRHACE